MRDRANRDAGIPASAPPTSSPSSGENERGMLQRLEEEKVDY